MRYLMAVILLGLLGCQSDSEIQPTTSPSGNIQFQLSIDENGSPYYTIQHQEKTIIDTSYLGFEFKDDNHWGTGISIVKTSEKEVQNDWEMQWGEQRLVKNHYQEFTYELEEKEGRKRKVNLEVRVYDDGLGFRYVFPKQAEWDSVIITDELTQFNLTGDHTTWWIPGDWDIYEHLYNTSPFSEIDALKLRNHPNLAQTHIPENAVNTPVTMKTAEGKYLSFHEANLTDYAGMTLKVDADKLSMTSELVGSDITGYKVKRKLPFETPWRTIQITEEAKDLIASNLIVNLNEPNTIGDVSWFKPKKYVGIWWEMHLGVSSWDKASGKHGATTANAKRYIDFAAENGFGGVLVEGWNTGWERWIGFEDREGVFDFITPYDDYDLEEVVRYADEKGVEIIMHHETSSAPRTYEQQLDTAYTLMNRLGIHAVKTGYVGKIIPKGEYHHGQWMVNHYRKVLEKGAEHQVAINAHEPIKATGIRRTYPNAISREGLRGQEFNAWASDGGNPPEHLPIIAFTRMLAGPIDFTPGVFDIKLSPKYSDVSTGGDIQKNQINTTLAQQLALYVVIYSPVQMACDLPQNYKDEPALQFISDVGVDWEQTKVLDGEVGDFVTIAREEKGTGNWFLGSITDENPREVEIDFSFLDPNSSYDVIVYQDGPDAHWNDNPTSMSIGPADIQHGSTMKYQLAAGGGLAISMMVK